MITNNNISIEEAISDVALYLRKSRGDLETDLIKHSTIMKEVCEKYSWRYVIYEEIGSGSTIKDRPKMQELMTDLEKDMYDAVLVVDFDRLGRGDEEDQGIIKKHLLKTETLVVECSPYRVLNLYDENDMQTVEFKGFLARQEYNMITKRLNRGKKIGAKLGNWSNGLSPFPYDYDSTRKGLIINKEKYEVYRDMINRLFQGNSLKQIAEHLNNINYPTPRSKYSKQQHSKWHGNTVASILKSEVHLGKVISNKTRYNKYKGSKVEIPKENWVVVENCHEVCKTQEEHEKILIMISSNQKKTTEFRHANLYTSLIKCYNCESTLHIQKRKNGKYSVRKCTSCDMQGGDCDFIINIVEDMITSIKDKSIQIADQLNKNGNQNSLLEKIQKTEDKINQLDAKKKRIHMGYIEEVYTSEEAKELSKPIESQIEQLKLELEKLKVEMSQVKTIDPEELNKRLSKVLSVLKSADDEKVNATLRKVIEGIFWDRKGDDLNVYIELKWT